MLLYVLATICIVSARGYSVRDDKNMVLTSEEKMLQWPERYTAKATSYSLTYNLVEDYTIWRTERKSRVDYNEGAVKVITTLPPDEYSYNAQKFEIYPKMTKRGGAETGCNIISDELFLSLDEIFPDTDSYEVVGNAVIGETETMKFENNFKYSTYESRKTIWAFHVNGHGWFPVRYEQEEYEVKTGSLSLHEIWTFSDCSVEVDEYHVFETSISECDNTNVTHTPDSEKITKELLFINPKNEMHVDHIYNHFQIKYERKFSHKDEQVMRKDIFREKMRMISSVNRRNLGYKLGVNEFADWTAEELERSHGEIPPPEGLTASVPFPYNTSEVNYIASKLPTQYDMRFYGLISSVKYQGNCGSCWSFAAAAVTESALARIKGGKVLALSNQAMMDCAYRDPKSKESNGCHGGTDSLAYDFIKKHGLPTEEEYGLYKEKDGFCRIEDMNKTYHITGYTYVPYNSFNAMKVAVAKFGPIYVSLHTSSAFPFYSSGIFKQNKRECPATPKTHAVALIGYGERDGNLFWILKNSYGTDWGMDGYMLIAARDNICGVTDKPSYPVF